MNKKIAMMLVVFSLIITNVFGLEISFADDIANNYDYSKKMNVDAGEINKEITSENNEDDSDVIYKTWKNYKYYIWNNIITIQKYTGNEKDVLIPNEIEGIKVKYIDQEAFNECSNIENITIEEGIVFIGTNAFYNCENLKTINMPGSVEEISPQAFNSPNIQNLNISEGSENYKSIDGIIYTNHSNGLYAYPIGRTTENYVIQDWVTGIANSAFANCKNIVSVKIPDSVKYIDFRAFYNCSNLKSIEIPSSIKTIEMETFYKCTSLSDVKLSENISVIDYYAFAECESLTNIRIPKSVKSMLPGVFKNCINLKHVLIENENIDMSKPEGESESDQFEGCKKITIYSIKGSELEKYAENKKIPFKDISKYEEDILVIETGKTTNSLNVRKGPSTKYESIGKLAKGTNVEIVEISSTGWYKIKYKEDYGYVSNKYVKLTQDEEIQKTGVTTSRLNVRKGPSTKYKSIGKLAKGTKVEIVEVSSTGWYKIKYKENYGYVSNKYVKLNQDEEIQKTGKTTSRLNVRKGPSTKYKSIGKLAKGTKVQILSKDTATGWYKIKYKSGYGYVSYKYVKVN